MYLSPCTTKLIGTLGMALLLTACGPAESDDGGAGMAADQLVPQVGSGKADGFAAAGATVGGSYRLRVTAARGSQVTLPLQAGQSIAVVVRRADDSGVEPFVALYEQGERVATNNDYQALLPMAAQTDAIVLYTAPQADELLLFVADRTLSQSGTLQLDIIAIEQSPPVDLTVTNALLRGIMAELRVHEPAIAAMRDAGAATEGDDGLLVAHPNALPDLRARAELARLVRAVNEASGMLFDEFVRANTGSSDPELARRAGSACSGLWRALREAAHSLAP